jgi:hypothetical protein
MRHGPSYTTIVLSRGGDAVRFPDQREMDPEDPAEEARPPEARFAIGAQLRNGDWFVIEPLALIWLAEPGPTIGLPLVATARGVLGVGGSGGAIGFGTGLGTTCATRGRCKLRDSMFSSIVDIEAAVERTYGGTTWRHATYMGPRLSSGGTDFKWSAGWMFDLDGGSNHHFQFGAGIGW